MNNKNSRPAPFFAAALASLAVSASAFAQTPLAAPGADGFISRARNFYNDADWQACLDQIDMTDLSAISPDKRENLEWQRAMAAFHLQRPDAEELLAAFLADYPASDHREDARMRIADCLFTVNYAQALAAYLKVDPDGLSPELRDDYTYRTAYCYLHVADYDNAALRFEALRGTDYDNAARFYLGYIAYVKGDYAKARQLFASVNTATPPGDMADYYLCQIYFAEADYNNALSTALKVVSRPSAPADFTAEANRIAGESLYLTGRSSEAIPYLRRYVSAVESPMLSSLYILGLSEYGQGDFRRAVATLAPVAQEDSSMGQNANLYVGLALLRLGDKDAAIISFDRAIAMRHDDKARENAYYNYAVAKYAGGNVPFGSSVTVFEDFLSQYPNSQYAEEVRSYIITGYLTDNNYEAALRSIERTANPSARVLAAKQQVLYTLGARDLAGGRIRQAIDRLEQADRLRSHNDVMARETDLALGEAYLRDGRLDDAAPRILSFLDAAPASDPNRPVAYYDLGYTRLAQKEYERAAINFRRITDKPTSADKTLVTDAFNRLGDALYYQKLWSEASDAYRRAFDLSPASGDYPLFQLAVIDGYTGHFDDKVARLDDFQRRFPGSALMPDVLLEKAEAQVRLGKLDNAQQSLTDLTRDYAQTTQSRQALLRLASTLDQSGQHDRADRTYREIITRYPSSDEAVLALDALKVYATANGTMDELMRFVASVENAPQVDVAEADRLSFQSAEQLYLDKGDTSRLRAYINQYPAGSGTVTALSYLMEEADADAKDDLAYDYAVRIVNQYPDNAVAEDALALKADIEYDRGQGELAMATWKELEKKASSPDNMALARMGIMRVARDLARPEELMAAADAVLATSSAGAEDRTEATFSRGLALQMLGRDSEARDLWASQADLTEDIYGAKSAVYLAQSLLDADMPDQARKVALDFVDKATSHSYWLARGFIVLSDISRAQGNTYEADSFLKALKKNYTGTEPDIFSMIDERLNNKDSK